VRWKNHWTMDRTALDDRQVIRFTENGQGIRSPFTQQVRWSSLSWWTDDGALLPLKSQTTYSDEWGNRC